MSPQPKWRILFQIWTSQFKKSRGSRPGSKKNVKKAQENKDKNILSVYDKNAESSENDGQSNADVLNRKDNNPPGE